MNGDFWRTWACDEMLLFFCLLFGAKPVSKQRLRRRVFDTGPPSSGIVQTQSKVGFIVTEGPPGTKRAAFVVAIESKERKASLRICPKEQ